MLRESATFNFGYSYSLGVVFLTIAFMYSAYLPLITIAVLVYFLSRFFIDAHLLLNVNKNRVESSGKIIHVAITKLTYGLFLFSIAHTLNSLNEDSWMFFSISCLLSIIILLFALLISNKEIITLNMFIDDPTIVH